MSVWSEVRRLARLKHEELAPDSAQLVPAQALIDASKEATRIKVRSCPANDVLLDGAEAAYDDHRQIIYYSRGTDLPIANFHISHEFAHHWLDDASASCGTSDIDCGVPAEPSMSSVGDADTYSPKQRTEALANLFARELLLPRDKIRRRCAEGAFDAELIAREFVVPVDLVMQQMADALLLPEEQSEEQREKVERDPDDSQREAIEAPPGPRQVRAGPGSGKTRTLVGRIAYLLAKGETPSSILALTYSNASAQDLAARIRAAVGEKAPAIWAGTFHSFGRELLRKYGIEIGLPQEPTLLDRTDSLLLLEELLPELELNFYLDLHEPVLKLRSIFNAICRAKDELATPDDYERRAQEMFRAAQDPKGKEKSLRASEVARVYGSYERALRSRGCVDFGDLVARPVELLRGHPEIRDAVRAQLRHILVDEYQDMNRASGLLLKELVTPGQGPWVVGDVRQAIYRFRGASPLNMSRFHQEYPDAKSTDLLFNYRSGGRIVRAFEDFGTTMASSGLASQGRLTAHRGDTSGEVSYEIAVAREAEAEGIANAILSRVAAGSRFGNHAILARSHKTLVRLASHLERAGVPCLYFGDFFERPEIRDLLSLLSVVAEQRGVGLLRVAQMPQYSVPPRDITLVFEWRRAKQIPMLAAVRQSSEIEGLSADGLRGLLRLANDLRDVEWRTTPHSFLMRYLFCRGDYLRTLLEDRSVAGQQKRLAVYQMIVFAFSFKVPAEGNPKRAFLDNVRRMEILDEEKQLRQPPAAAVDIDGVRLMTVHASKGLEFPIVHMPTLASRLFPPQPVYDPCPPPDGLIDADVLMTREAEEDSLFFVGMSRAMDVLHISRALTYGGWSTKKPSRFLGPIATHLPKALESPPTWTELGTNYAPWSPLTGERTNDEWTVYEIETYLDCPRRFYYDRILVLTGDEEKSPYMQFQKTLHATLAWMRSTSTPEERHAGFDARFEEEWSRFGPTDHPFAEVYRKSAQKMIGTALGILDGESLTNERAVTLPGCGAVIRFKVDHVQASGSKVIVHRLKTSRLASDKEKDKARYVLWQLAAQNDHAGKDVSFEHVSLLNGDRKTATMDGKKLNEKLQIIEDVVRKIAAGEFEPDPDDRCPYCPYFFICPSHGDVR